MVEKGVNVLNKRGFCYDTKRVFAANAGADVPKRVCSHRTLSFPSLAGLFGGFLLVGAHAGIDHFHSAFHFSLC